MANVPTVHSAAPRVPRAGLLVLAAAFAVAVLAGTAFSVLRSGGADQSRPVADHALAGSHDMTKAFAELAQRAGVDAALPAAPRGLSLWAVALEPGAPGAAAGTLVLDYYAGAKPPKELTDLAGYAGPRVQVIYRPGAAVPAGTESAVIGGREVAVQRAETGAVYYIPSGGLLVEVRSWSTGSQPAPAGDDLAPLFGSLK